MKLLYPLSLVGLAVASPVPQDSAMASIASPVWMADRTQIYDPMMGSGYGVTLTTEPVALDTATDQWCASVGAGSEPWCPINPTWASVTYSNLAAVMLMPNSVSTGVLDESEIPNLAGFASGWTTGGACNSPAFTTNMQQSMFDMMGAATTLPLADAACTEIGAHGAQAATFADFEATAVDCTESRYVMCYNAANPMGGDGFPADGDVTHGDVTADATNKLTFDQANVDLVVAAFDIMNDPNYVPPTTAAPTTAAPTTVAPVTTAPAATTDAPAAASNTKWYVIIAVVIVIVAVVVLQMKK